MSNIRIKDLTTTATSFNTDDYIALDGASGGTRKMLAATLPLTDVTFGSSGPSAKSSIAARAARQGLVFDGTAAATLSGPTFGTGNFAYAIWINPTAIAQQAVLIGTTLNMGIRSSGVWYTNAGDFSPSLTAGKAQLVVYSRSSGTASYYLNGVLGSTATDSTSYGQLTNISTSAQFAGSLSGVYIYNRALSAAEVVALYEAGVPAGADYNTATNTSQTSGTFALATGSGTVTSASATGFTASITGNSFGVVSAATARSGITVGSKFLVTFSATLTSGDTPKVYLANTATAGNTTGVTASVNVSSGSNSIVLTGSSNVSTTLYLNFQPPSTGSASYAISSITITPLGLLLAPDAGQAGGGLTWYDTSGNAANITLPASGVSWNVPSSRYLGGDWTTSGNLTVSGTGASTVNGGFSISGSAVSANNRACVDISFQTTYGKVSAINRGVGNFPLALNPEGGSVLVNTTTNSGNGAVQLYTHTTSAGGIGFGTDLSLYRSASGSIALGASSGVWSLLATIASAATASAATQYEPYGTVNSSNPKWLSGQRFSDHGKFSVWAYDGSNHLASALSIDSSQNATFAGPVTISKSQAAAYTSLTIQNGNASGYSQLNMISGSNTASINYAPGVFFKISIPSADSFQVSTNNITALTLDSSQRCILAGALRLNNAYVSGAPTATGYVTLQDSAGNTYKVLVGT